MYFVDFNRYNIRKILKKVLKEKSNFFNTYNVIYINKKNNNKTNVYTAIDVLEEHCHKIFEIIDLLDNDYFEIYRKIKNIIEKEKTEKSILYIILSNKNLIDFKRNFFKYLNNLNLSIEEKQKYFNFLNKINFIIE